MPTRLVPLTVALLATAGLFALGAYRPGHDDSSGAPLGGLPRGPNAPCPCVWYVDDDAPGDPGPGTPDVSDPFEDGSPERPFDAIEEAYSESSSGDTIIVLDGVYVGFGNKNLTPRAGVLLRSANGPDNCVIDCEGVGRGFEATGNRFGAVVDGLTIRRGLGASDGGGISCDGVVELDFVNCLIVDCSGYNGGGAWLRESDVGLLSCVFRSNVAVNAGGGVATLSNARQARFMECEFVENSADQGGGAFLERALIERSYFEYNTADHGGGGISGRFSSVTSCAFHANNISFNDGRGGALYLAETQVANCTLTSNEAPFGGGAWVDGIGTVIRETEFLGNTAILSGGAFAQGSGCAAILNCLMAGNAAGFYGGGIFGRTSLRNCTVTQNTSGGFGGGWYQFAQDSSAQDTIFVGNSAPFGTQIALEGAARLVLVTCDVVGENAIYAAQLSYPFWITPNINADPAFVDPDGLDDDPNTLDDNDYRLSAGSPCIDAGNQEYVWNGELDFAGHVRLWDGNNDGMARLDLGPWEFGASCPGDLDADGTITLADVALLLANFGNPGIPNDGDNDGNALVDLSDLSVMLSAFGTSCD